MGAAQIGYGITLEDALADAWTKAKSGQVVVTQIERETGGILFRGVDVKWPHGKPAIPQLELAEEATDNKDAWAIRGWANEQIVKTCLTTDESLRVLDRFMATRGERDESAVMDEPDELEPAEAFARESWDDEGLQDEPGDEATPENEAPVIPDEDMETFGAVDLDDAARELVAA
jgi:hypothetical protein